MSQSCSCPSTSPIGFLSLPVELRLIVYENLPIRTTLHELNLIILGYPSLAEYPNLVIQSVAGVCILATCRTIYSEAWPIFRKLDFIRQEPLRITASPEALWDHKDKRMYHGLRDLLRRIQKGSIAAPSKYTERKAIFQFLQAARQRSIHRVEIAIAVPHDYDSLVNSGRALHKKLYSINWQTRDAKSPIKVRLRFQIAGQVEGRMSPVVETATVSDLQISWNFLWMQCFSLAGILRPPPCPYSEAHYLTICEWEGSWASGERFSA